MDEQPVPRLQTKHVDRSQQRMNTVSKVLLCYPIVYVCLTLPTAVIRVGQFANHEYPLASAYVAASISQCTGWVNVILYTSTLKGIISWNWLWPKRKPTTTNETSSHPTQMSQSTFVTSPLDTIPNFPYPSSPSTGKSSGEYSKFSVQSIVGSGFDNVTSYEEKYIVGVV
jgi:G protein-coupled glucose receptor regulating Gpa2 C-term